MATGPFRTYVGDQPHWQGLPDWQPQPQPEPQPQAPNKGRFLISAGCWVSRSWVGSGVLGDSAMGPSFRHGGVGAHRAARLLSPISCPVGRAHQRRTEASYAPGVRIPRGAGRNQVTQPRPRAAPARGPTRAGRPTVLAHRASRARRPARRPMSIGGTTHPASMPVGTGAPAAPHCDARPGPPPGTRPGPSASRVRQGRPPKADRSPTGSREGMRPILGARQGWAPRGPCPVWLDLPRPVPGRAGHFPVRARWGWAPPPPVHGDAGRGVPRSVPWQGWAPRPVPSGAEHRGVRVRWGWAPRGRCPAGLSPSGFVPGVAGPPAAGARQGWALPGPCAVELGTAGRCPARLDLPRAGAR